MLEYALFQSSRLKALLGRSSRGFLTFSSGWGLSSSSSSSCGFGAFGCERQYQVAESNELEINRHLPWRRVQALELSWAFHPLAWQVLSTASRSQPTPS